MEFSEKKLVRVVGRKDMDIDYSKIKYLLTYFEDYINKCIHQVLNDSAINPDYSAVAANNLIKSYIQIEEEMGEKLKYSTVEEYFLHHGFSKRQYDIFEKSRKLEAPYYRGIQY